LRRGGEPANTPGPGARLHPRKSFEAWQETVRLRSAPWDEAEAEAVSHLDTIVDPPCRLERWSAIC
jgi:two-component system, chemotaxis family, sensor kinase Cph1